jgi:uncharacterized protein
MSELHKPLTKRAAPKAAPFSFFTLFACLALLPLLLGGLALLFLPQLPAQTPYAIAPFPQEVTRAPVVPPPVAQKGPTISIIDGMTGRSQEVPLPNGLMSQDTITPLKIPVTPALNAPITHDIKPLEAFSALFKPTLKQAALPRVAIIIGGKDLPQVYEKLPQATTLALPSLVSDAPLLAEKMRGRGFEILLQLPPEDLGKEAMPLKAGALPKQNSDALAVHLARFSSYIGVFLPASPKLTTHEASFSQLLREINQRGLLMVEDGTSANSLTLALGKSLQTPALRVDVVLESGGTLAQRFLDLETIAKREGAAIGYLSASQAAMLNSWARGAEARGVAFVPLSALLARKGL